MEDLQDMFIVHTVEEVQVGVRFAVITGKGNIAQVLHLCFSRV